MVRPDSVRDEAGGVVLYNGRVVLHRTAKGNLNFPKGKIEPGEAPEQTAAREVLEETGLVAEPLEPLGTLELRYIPKPQTIQFFLMHATMARGWAEHAGRDAELAPVEAVGERLTFKEYRRFWRTVAERVAAAVRELHPNRRPAVFREPFAIIYSDDVPRLSAFYTDGFGFAPDFRWPSDPAAPPEFVVLKLGPHALGIGRADAPALHGRPTSATGPAATFELCLETDDVDVAVQRLLGLGATLLVPPADQPWRERMAYVADPEGRPLHLFMKLGET